jgi:diguanylate cyclase (GGDEF)-like protein
VARFGGEEFAVVLPRTDAVNAVLVAEKLCDVVRDEPFEVDGHVVSVTMSVGIATYLDNATDPAGLLAAADAALYRAKSAGRDCIEVAAAPDDAISTV